MTKLGTGEMARDEIHRAVMVIRHLAPLNLAALNLAALNQDEKVSLHSQGPTIQGVEDRNFAEI